MTGSSVPTPSIVSAVSPNETFEDAVSGLNLQNNNIKYPATIRGAAIVSDIKPRQITKKRIGSCPVCHLADHDLANCRYLWANLRPEKWMGNQRSQE